MQKIRDKTAFLENVILYGLMIVMSIGFILSSLSFKYFAQKDLESRKASKVASTNEISGVSERIDGLEKRVERLENNKTTK